MEPYEELWVRLPTSVPSLELAAVEWIPQTTRCPTEPPTNQPTNRLLTATGIRGFGVTFTSTAPAAFPTLPLQPPYSINYTAEVVVAATAGQSGSSSSSGLEPWQVALVVLGAAAAACLLAGMVMWHLALRRAPPQGGDAKPAATPGQSCLHPGP